MLDQIARIQPKGLLTIPKKFREELGLEKDSLVKIMIQDRSLIIKPVYIHEKFTAKK